MYLQKLLPAINSTWNSFLETKIIQLGLKLERKEINKEEHQIIEKEIGNVINEILASLKKHFRLFFCIIFFWKLFAAFEGFLFCLVNFFLITRYFWSCCWYHKLIFFGRFISFYLLIIGVGALVGYKGNKGIMAKITPFIQLAKITMSAMWMRIFASTKAKPTAVGTPTALSLFINRIHKELEEKLKSREITDKQYQIEFQEILLVQKEALYTKNQRNLLVQYIHSFLDMFAFFGFVLLCSVLLYYITGSDFYELMGMLICLAYGLFIYGIWIGNRYRSIGGIPQSFKPWL